MSKMLAIELNPSLCTACGACTVACMDQNDLKPQDAMDSYRKIVTVENGSGLATKFIYLSLACMHCAQAPCIDACPCGCIQKDEETGFTIYDNSACIGCRSCSMACPFAAPIFNQEGKMHKCDGCNTRVKNGLLPACVRVCPFDALSLVERNELPKVHMEKSVIEIANALLGE